MAGTMRHLEDDGELSIIASDAAIIVACNQGHYWQIDAELKPAPQRGGVADRGLPSWSATPLPAAVEEWLDTAARED